MEKATAKKVAIVGIVAIAAYLLWKKNQPVPAAEAAPPIDAWQAPYLYTTPGLDPNTIIMNGNPSAFISTYDISVSADNLNYLTNKYMPLFGFVGVTGIGIQ